MHRHWKNVGLAAALVVCCALVGQTVAQEESSVMVGEPEVATELTMPAPADMAAPTPADMAAPVAAVETAACCPAPCIDYRTHLSARRMLRCQSQIQVVMAADNPADCEACPVEIPMCIPCCCIGAPSIDSRCGLLGRGVVEYCWPCGFSAKVVFRARGDVVVHYRG